MKSCMSWFVFQDAYSLHGSHSSIYEQTLEAVSLANSLNTAAAFTPLFAAANSSMMQSAAAASNSAAAANLFALGSTSTNPCNTSGSVHLVAPGSYAGQNTLAPSAAAPGANVSNLGLSLPLSPFRSSLHQQYGLDAASSNVASLLPAASYLSPISNRNSNSGILDMTSDPRRNSDVAHLSNPFASRLSPPGIGNPGSVATSVIMRQNSLADSRIGSPVGAPVGILGAAGSGLNMPLGSSTVLNQLASTSLGLLHGAGDSAGCSSSVGKVTTRKLSIPSIKVERDSPPCEHSQEGVANITATGEASPSSNNSIITLSSDEEDSKF